MKLNFIYALIAVAIMQSGCVQKTKSVTINLKLHISGVKNIKHVGVRGNGKPLS